MSLAEANAIAGDEPAGVVAAPQGSFFGSVPASAVPARAAAAARAAEAISCSILPIRSFRLSAWRASCTARTRSASSAFSVSDCLRWRSCTSTVIRVLSCESAARSRPSTSRSAAISLRTLTSSARSATSVSTSIFMSGSTAPSKIAARTDWRASSGLTSRAGGGRRPSRCRAASTSAITARRLPSERRTVSSLPDSALSRRFGRRDAVLDGADIGRPSRSAAALSLRRSSPIASSSALSLAASSAALFCSAWTFSEFLLPRALGGFGRDRDPLRQRRQAGDEQDTRGERRHGQPARCLEEAGQGHHANWGPKFIEEPLTLRIAAQLSYGAAARSSGHKCVRGKAFRRSSSL